MKKAVIISTLIIAIALTGTFVVKTLDAQATPAPQVKSSVATCNVMVIFENYKKAKDLFAQYSKQDEEIMAERNTRLEKIEELSNTLKGLDPSSAEYENSVNELQRQQINLEAWIKFKTSTSSSKRTQLTKEMYGDMQSAIAKVAKQKGYSLVMFASEGPLVSNDPKNIIAEITQRMVLYSDSSVDITTGVLQELNASYAAGK